jgi:hypothetical protein
LHQKQGAGSGLPPWPSYLFLSSRPESRRLCGSQWRDLGKILPLLKSMEYLSAPSASPPVISNGAGQFFLPFRSRERLACAERPLHHHARSLCVMKSLCRPFFSRLSSLFSFFPRTRRGLRQHPNHQLRLCVCLIPGVVPHSRILRVPNFAAKLLHRRSHLP